MKKYAKNNFNRFLPLAAVLLLCACAGQQMSMTMPVPKGEEPAALTQTKATEAAGWQTVSARAPGECGASNTPPARDRAVEQSDCVTALIKQHVLPVAAFPDLLLASRQDARRLAVSYAGGKLTPQQYQAMAKSRMDDYRQKWRMQAATETLMPGDAKPAPAAAKPKPPAEKPTVARL